MLLLSQTFFLAPKRAFLYLGGLRPKLSLKGDAINLHEQWMRFALRLAETGRGQTSPNPMVGAVVVKEGNLLGFGAHLRAGTPHAEVHALNMARSEEHTSELQSRENLVCRLLLEKKKDSTPTDDRHREFTLVRLRRM